MLENKALENIRAHGTYRNSGRGRLKILVDDLDFRMDEKAEYVIIGGCRQPEDMPHVFRALKKSLDHLQIDYTMLSKEYCCGWVPLAQSAVIEKNEREIARAKELSKTFILQNFSQSEALGARSIALFCPVCEANYSNCKNDTKIELISCNELLNRHLKNAKSASEIDYYPGCFRFRRLISAEPVNLEAAEQIIKKIQGLRVNYPDRAMCCFVQSQLEKLISSFASHTVATICPGCYNRLRETLALDYQVKMLPEIVWEAIRSNHKGSKLECNESSYYGEHQIACIG